MGITAPIDIILKSKNTADILHKSEKALRRDFKERTIASSPTAEAAEREIVSEVIHKSRDMATGKNKNTKTAIPKKPNELFIIPRYPPAAEIASESAEPTTGKKEPAANFIPRIVRESDALATEVFRDKNPTNTAEKKPRNMFVTFFIPSQSGEISMPENTPPTEERHR